MKVLQLLFGRHCEFKQTGGELEKQFEENTIAMVTEYEKISQKPAV